MDIWDERTQLNLDKFDIAFRRQGWLHFTYPPQGSDPQVLRQQRNESQTKPIFYGAFGFFKRFGNTTFRKILRAIYAPSGASRETLQRICSNTGTLDDYLFYLQDQDLAHENSGVWRKTPQWARVDNIGRTLEWYVSQWFRFELGATARYGVHVPNLPGGGDLDVVAIMDGMRLAVECKSGKEITEKQLRYFLLRARAFRPALAILLLDTDSDKPMEQVVKSLNSLNENDPAGDPLTLQNQSKTLYWGMQRVYVVSVKKQSIGDAIASALRLYHSDIRFRAFFA